MSRWQRVINCSFEVAVCVGLLGAGLAALLPVEEIAGLRAVALFGPIWGPTWYAVLALGAALVLTAMAWRTAVTALLIERAGLVVLGWQLAVMGVLVQFVAAETAIHADGVVCLALAAGCVGRIVRIHADLRELARVPAP